MPRTSSNGKIIYSVDLMIAYINIFKPKASVIKLSDIHMDLDAKGWGESNISVNDVLANKKKYMADYNRIKSADLSYTIMHNGVMY